MPSSAQAVGGSSSCIISGNTISPGNFYDGSSNGTVYTYQHGGIWVRNSANITNNIYRTTTPTSTPSVSTSDVVPVLLSNGIDFNVTNNRIERESISVGNYIGFKFLSNYPSVGLEDNCRGIITENIFDSYITNGSNTDTIDLNINGTMGESSQWIVERNINQTEIIRLRIEDGMIYNRDNTNLSQVGATTNVIGYNNDGYFEDVYIEYKTTNNSTFGILYNLSNLIPYGVHIIDMSLSHSSYSYLGGKTEYFMEMVLYANSSYQNVRVDYPNTYLLHYTTLTPSSDIVNNKHNSSTSSIKLSLEFTAEMAVIDASVSFYYVDVKFRW